MLATRGATEAAYAPDTEGDALDRLTGDEREPPVFFFSDDSFGTAAQCAADALFLKQLSLIVVPAMALICLLTLILA